MKEGVIEKTEKETTKKIKEIEEEMISNIIVTTTKAIIIIVEKTIKVEMLGTVIMKKILDIGYIICMEDIIMIPMLTIINTNSTSSNYVKQTHNRMQNGIENIIVKCKEIL